MNSMTGFGKAEAKTKLGRLSVEISSVNNRFLEISTKLPRPFFAVESKIRDMISAHINRGKVYLYVGFDESDDSATKYTINEAAAKSYLKQLKKVQKELKLGGEITIKDLLALPEIAEPPRQTFDEATIWGPVSKVVKAALKELIAMRKREGAAIAADMKARLDAITATTKEIESHAGEYVELYRERIKKRLDELLEMPVDKARIEEEVVIAAERTDITEECTRLKIHTDEFRKSLKNAGASGKRINFVLQEMNREANTIASKCSDLRISTSVISLKEEVERLREQIQNVE